MERQYFYILDDEQCGPFVLADLIDVNLPPEILVWYEGMAEWQPAHTMPELQEMYQAQAQAQAQAQVQVPNRPQVQIKPQGNPTLKFFRIVLALALVLFSFALVASGFENKPLEMTPFVMAVIFFGVGLWLLLKKSKYKPGNIGNQGEYTATDGSIYAEQMNMMQQDDSYDDGGDFD